MPLFTPRADTESVADRRPTATAPASTPRRRFTIGFGRSALAGLTLATGLAGTASWLDLRQAQAQAPAPADKGANVAAKVTAKELRIGYQKSASLLVLQKAQGTLEKRLGDLAVSVRWIEFPAGPQLLEGLNVGAVDVGYVGEAPPIFAQAAGARFVYVGFDPAAAERARTLNSEANRNEFILSSLGLVAPTAEAILVPKDSALKSVAELKGRKVALNKGSNVHYLLVRQLEKHGLSFSDIQPVYLAPADGRAAFESGSVDAWVIWDPFQAAAEKAINARVLADGSGGVVNNYQYYLAARDYASANGAVIDALFADSVERGRWLKANLTEAAALIAPQQGLPPEVVELALTRYQFDVKPITKAVAEDQQRIADTFHSLKLIPKAIRISDAVLPQP